jgi:hypothetical protein
VGNPVLGALCAPEPLKELDFDLATRILDLGHEAALASLPVDDATLKQKQQQVEALVLPAFSRAGTSLEEDLSNSRRQAFNRDLYIRTRTYGEFIPSKNLARTFERKMGRSYACRSGPRCQS